MEAADQSARRRDLAPGPDFAVVIVDPGQFVADARLIFAHAPLFHGAAGGQFDLDAVDFGKAEFDGGGLAFGLRLADRRGQSFVQQHIGKLFDLVFGRAVQFPPVEFDGRKLGGIRLRRQFFHGDNVPFHSRNGFREFGGQIDIPPDGTAELIFQRLDLPEPRLDSHLAPHQRVAGNLG